MTAHAPPFPVDEIWDSLDPASVWTGDWAQFRHRDQERVLHDLVRDSPLGLTFDTAGLSAECRTIWRMDMGAGPRRVLIWARQHGNEPDCSAALNIVMRRLATMPEHPIHAAILAGVSMRVVPMVNPDGVRRYTRQSATGIDLNRDAVALSQPEAQTLFRQKEEFQPEFAFNLHDMGARKSTAGGDLVALAYQAGPFDSTDSDNAVRLKAKAVIGEMARAARVKAPSNIARYTAGYMHRAFGDSMMRWGVACMLIESGGWYADLGGDEFVVRLHALSLLAGLHAIATRADASLSATAYDDIPFDGGGAFFDRLFSGARVFDGGAHMPFRADIAVNADRRIRRASDHHRYEGDIEGLGDLEDVLRKEHRDLPGHVISPGLIAMAPEFCFGDRLPEPAAVMPFLRAGIATAAVSFGPFATARDRDDFARRTALAEPPINILALENVASLDTVLRRHGLSELAGMSVTGLAIAPQDLIDFIHLYHPAHHSAIPAEEQEGLIGLNVVFLGASSPRNTGLHLHLLPTVPREAGRIATVSADQLRRIAEELLRHPEQITYSRSGIAPMPEFLPITVAPVGVTPSDPPEPGHLARILHRFGRGDEGSLTTLISMMTGHLARALRLERAGHIRVGFRADFAAWPESILTRSTPDLPPTVVVVNGDIVIDRDRGIERPARGIMHLA